MQPVTVEPVDFDAHYTIGGWSEGIAWRLLGYVMVRDEDYDWSGIEEEDRSRVRAVMVGDDRIFTADVDDLTVIGEEDFCRGCGQVGCGCEVWS
jgi:hypothetical protein